MALLVLEKIYVHVMWLLGVYCVESMTIFEEAPLPPPTGSNAELIERISYL
jgi:hypothetical protein